jgi:hypothetical protein
MDEQIAIGRTADLHPIGAEPKLSRDAHRLAVAVHEHPTGNCLHVTGSMCVRPSVDGASITKDQRLLSRLAKDSQAVGLAVDLEAWRSSS